MGVTAYPPQTAPPGPITFQYRCRVAEGAGLGDDGDYDWPGMSVEITRRVFEEGLPKSQAEWIRELQDWFAAQSETGEFPDERSIRRRLTPILKAVKFKNPKR